jgi:hypothetical protein
LGDFEAGLAEKPDHLIAKFRFFRRAASKCFGPSPMANSMPALLDALRAYLQSPAGTERSRPTHPACRVPPEQMK